MSEENKETDYTKNESDEITYYLVEDFNYGEEPTSIIAEQKITQEEKVIYTFYLAHAYYNENKFILYAQTFVEPMVLAMSIGNEIEGSAIIYDIAADTNRKSK